MLVLPSITTPAARSRATTVASYGDMNPSSMREPQVVRTPRVQKMSLWAIGTPVSGPPCPAARRASARAASASAASAVTVMKALPTAWCCSMRARKARVSSTLETARAASSDASSATVFRCNALIR
jgi:hypothetical protein